MAHLTAREARTHLEQAVRDYDWAKEFLGPGLDAFLRSYRSLSAQLRPGDRLAIEIERHEWKDETSYPTFCIVLYAKEGRKVLDSRARDFSTSSALDNLLYQDE